MKSKNLPQNKVVPHTRLAAPAIPTDITKWKKESFQIMKGYNHDQLRKLYEIAQIITKQANELLENEHTTQLVHQAEIMFKPILNRIYYLYERNNRGTFLSLISPDEWSEMKGNFIQAVKMKSDNAWELVRKD